MIELPILRDLGYFLLAAAILALVARRIRMPAIVAYTFAGLALGPILHIVTVSEALDFLSHFGIALLLFVVGLELSLDRIRDVGRVALLAGGGQILITTLGGAAVCIAVVVVKLLDQKNELDTLYGRIAVGIFLVQDVVVILVLTFVAGLGSGTNGAQDTIFGMLRAFAGMGLLLVVAATAARWVLPGIYAWLADSFEAMFIFSLTWCLAFVMGAEALHLSLEIGAFLAGISLAQLPYNHELHRRVHPLMNFCIAVFFVSLGAGMQPAAAADDLFAAFVLTVFVLVGSPLIFLWIIVRLGYGERTAFLTGVAVAQVSEFSFILAATARQTGLVDDRVVALIGVVGLATISLSAYMILYNHQLYDVLRRRGLLRWVRARPEPEPQAEPVRRNHIVVVGMNALSRRIVAALSARGEQVLVVDTDPAKLRGLPCETVQGNVDHLSVVYEADIPRARLVVGALQIEDTNRLLAFRCRRWGVPVAIHAFDEAVVRDLLELGADHLIVSKRDGLRVIVSELARAGVID
jgi:Kef-type K+ transport system membrane component KefB